MNISDDVIVYGKTQTEHDESLTQVFERFSNVNLPLIDPCKCEFNKSSLSFFGFIFSKDGGDSPDPEKVRAIHNNYDSSKVNICSPQFSRHGNLLCQIHSFFQQRRRKLIDNGQAKTGREG